MADEENSIETNEEDNNIEYESDGEMEEPPQEPETTDENSSSSSDSDSDYSSDDSDSEEGFGTRKTKPPPKHDPADDYASDDDSPEANIARFTSVLESKSMKRKEKQEDKDYVFHEDLYDFPKDPENWREEDLQEMWADGPLDSNKPGWDPAWADDEDWDAVMDEIEEGRDPPIAPFYLPYRKNYPAIPDNHYDISNPKAVIEELDRIEEFMKWVSYVFPDGSSYEGTVWDDLAHGKGVYVAEQGLVRYEGEWLQNNMEGHGVVEVDIPDVEPVPGSKLEEKMRAEGRIIKRDYMSPEDREWLEMDIEDSYKLAGGWREIPFYENNEWIKQFGQKPEKGRYRYAGQWKHGRMHGCGVYEVNERPIFGRFYFGQLVENDFGGCDLDTSTLHAGIAEVAAAKARMFVNKPDGMVREERGPYSDPQHPYMYEEDDVWMAPGFINQFYEVPDIWKTYVEEVDQEREMWLNSFYKAPLRIPMPAELEYWWQNEEEPEFVILKKEPKIDPEDPSKRIYTEPPLILHTKTGRLINYVEDEKHGVRLFWQPPLKPGEEPDPKKAEFLPLGFDEFYGRTGVTEEKGGLLDQIISAVGNTCNPLLDKLEKWREEKKKASELKLQLIEKELELIEAEICLEEAMEDMETELEMKQKEEEKKVEMEEKEKSKNKTSPAVVADEEEGVEEDDDEDDDEDDGAPSSFGSAPRKSPFAATSLSFVSGSTLSTVPSRLQESFLSWKKNKRPPAPITNIPPPTPTQPSNSVSFAQDPSSKFKSLLKSKSMTAVSQKQLTHPKTHVRSSQLHSLSKILSNLDKQKFCREEVSETYHHSILSMHVPIPCFENNYTG
ncbi:hypothetical protein ACHQM5_020270 [Ranunculus cassubicifolius]